jgi:DNA-binding FadR family transcriptional regulator
MHGIEGMLESMSDLAARSTQVSTTLGARALVLGKFLETAAPQLTASQCILIGQAFKRGIEDIMSQMDNTPLPQAFHSELLSLTNDIIAELAQRAR